MFLLIEKFRLITLVDRCLVMDSGQASLGVSTQLAQPSLLVSLTINKIQETLC